MTGAAKPAKSPTRQKFDPSLGWTVKIREQAVLPARHIPCFDAIEAEKRANFYASLGRTAYICFGGLIWMRAGHRSKQRIRSEVA